DQLENEFAASGLAHVLSISGLHVAILALVLLKTFRFGLSRFWTGSRRMDARRVASAAAIPAIWAYVALTGWQPPAIRSALLASGVFIGMFVWRGSDTLNGLGYAAMVITVIDPGSISSLSLHLSFLAVLSLILLAPAFREWIPWKPGPPSEGAV